jgi:hypothetical protein
MLIATDEIGGKNSGEKMRALVDFTPHSWALLKRYLKRFRSEFDSLALVLYLIFQWISCSHVG